MAKFRFKGLRNTLYVLLGEAKSHVKKQTSGMGGAYGHLDKQPHEVCLTQTFQAPLKPHPTPEAFYNGLNGASLARAT